MLIDFLGPPSDPGGGGPFRILSFVDVLEGRFDPALVRDRIVLLGPTIRGVDEHATPTTGDTRMWGVEILGNAVETVLYQRFLVPAGPRRHHAPDRAHGPARGAGGGGVAAAARRASGGGRTRPLRHRGGPALRARHRARPGLPAHRAADQLRGRALLAPRAGTGGAANGPRGDGTLPLAGGEPVGARRSGSAASRRRDAGDDGALQRSPSVHHARSRAAPRVARGAAEYLPGRDGGRGLPARRRARPVRGRCHRGLLERADGSGRPCAPRVPDRARHGLGARDAAPAVRGAGLGPPRPGRRASIPGRWWWATWARRTG